MKAIKRSEFTIDIDGSSFTGTRVIEGTRILHQTIQYNGLTKYDGHPYKPIETLYMESVARLLLRELIQESKTAGGHMPNGQN